MGRPAWFAQTACFCVSRVTRYLRKDAFNIQPGIYETASRNCFANADRRTYELYGGYDQGVRYPRSRRPPCLALAALTPPTSPTKSGSCWSRCWPPPRSEGVRQSSPRGVSQTRSSTCSGADVPGGCCPGITRLGRRCTTISGSGAVTGGSGEPTSGCANRFARWRVATGIRAGR